MTVIERITKIHELQRKYRFPLFAATGLDNTKYYFDSIVDIPLGIFLSDKGNLVLSLEKVVSIGLTMNIGAITVPVDVELVRF